MRLSRRTMLAASAALAFTSPAARADAVRLAGGNVLLEVPAGSAAPITLTV